MARGRSRRSGGNFALGAEVEQSLPSVRRASEKKSDGLLEAQREVLRPIVIVLGMHRTGTSLCSQVLSAFGVDMASEITPNEGNKKGHWERWEIVDLHDEILRLVDRGYFTASHDLPFPPAWWALPTVRGVRDRIEAFLKQRMGSEGLFGFKDPRTTRLLPMWFEIFKRLKLAPKFILCQRSPAQVARSLKMRDGLDPNIGEYRWLAYTADCYRYTANHDLCVINYESWFESPNDNLEKLMTHLGLRWEQSEADLHALISGVVDRDLRHDDNRRDSSSQPLLRSFFNLARGIDGNSGARAQIDAFVNQFVSFQQLLTAFEPALRERTALAANLSEAEARLAALSAQLAASEAQAAELEAAVAASARREAELNEAIAVATADLEAARAGLAGAAAREEALRAAAAEPTSELEAAVAALRRAEAELDEVRVASAAQIRDLESQLEALGGERERLSSQLEHATADLSRATKQGAARAAQIRDLESQLEALGGEKERLSSQLENIAADLSRATEQGAAQIRDLESQLEALGGERERLSSQLEHTTADLSRATKQGAARAAALEAAHAAALALSENRAMARTRAVQSRLIEAEAALAKGTRRAADGAVWKWLLPTSDSLSAQARLLIKSGLFDEEWYKSQYPDAAESRRRPAEHFLEDGYLRGCKPNPFFDPLWYLERYEDVRKSGLNPLVHYLQHGSREGRDPGPHFKTEFYLSANPDVRDSGVNPLAHYLKHGRHEGRRPEPRT